ncbi:hypothetical protein [Gloeocapsopsis dulcis]|uniref:Uncharacterized protein n=1 Tax=Gloeocapsopsis dulcis AAB1 = 1H9 TaxID=1433147 RepID=A0A6N8G0U2_9CHRO|nr:hypothetical protein [Gloeocapsopsis dulcis]MUL38512.1 hypothetical protein [Gloeocapsopsis dulcis AAB1 = 1H9]WNN91626.1 hypothetical protein P0S91_11375 [Gloeocapsopsis dulcis]
MQQIFAVLKQAFRQSLVILGLVSLMSVSCLLIFATQPSMAASKSMMQQETMSQDTQKDVSTREQAYEDQVQAAENPEKVYKENVKGTGEGVVQKAVEGAKEAVSKATGNE